MYSLLRYLVKYGAFILFVVFEILAFYWVITYNQNQQRIFKYSADEMVGRLYHSVDNVQQYLHLRKVADSLAARTAQLETNLLLKSGPASFDQPYRNNEDTVSGFSFMAARIISNSVNLRNNRMILNKGSADGIRPGMGILTEKGPAGVVVKTSKNYSVVMSILNSQSLVSASLKGSSYFGSLLWENTNPQNLTLMAIPKYVTVNLGDTIVTSGYSFIFPGGRDIGTIESYGVPAGSNFYEIEVEMLYDMANLNYVYIVENLNSEELDSLYAR